MPRSINNAIVPEAIANPCYDMLLDLMPDEWRERLAIYTLEELFYVWQLINNCPRDAFFMGLRAKQLAYLRGEKRPGAYGILSNTSPLSPMVWAKLGYKFAYAWSQWIAEHGVDHNVRELANVINSKRVA